ncbi:MAG: hypothetical protein QM529_01910 [Hydrotalea sp.]|nr:hypothetical protein [Hydrotalea sp.]
MRDFIIFFRREASLCSTNFYYYLLPLFLWLTGFFVLRLALPDVTLSGGNADHDFIFILLWFLFLLFFSLCTMGGALYQSDMAQDLAVDIILSGRSLLAFVYAKVAGLLVFSGLPLWLMSILALGAMGAAQNTIEIFCYGGLLFLAHLCLLINFLASLSSWGRGVGFFMVIIILPLAIPCFIFVLVMLTSGNLQPAIFFQLAYFILCFSFLPMASAFIIKQEG